MVSSRSLSEVVSSQGRFIAAETARGAARPETRIPSAAQRPPCRPASATPPWARQARLPRRRCRLLRAVSHAAAPLRGKTGAGHAPPAGGANAHTSLPQAPRRPGGHRLLGRGVARDWLGWRGGAARAPARRQAGAGAWEPDFTPGARELRAGGRGPRRAGAPGCCRSLGERAGPDAAGAARAGRCGAGSWSAGLGPPPPPPAVRRWSFGPGFKEEPQRVAECERARVTSGGAAAAPSRRPTRLSLVRTQTADWLTLAATFALWGVFENLKSKLFVSPRQLPRLLLRPPGLWTDKDVSFPRRGTGPLTVGGSEVGPHTVFDLL